MVEKILIGSQVNEKGEIGVNRIAFAPAETTLHAHAIVANVRESTLINGAWWYNDGDVPRKIYDVNVTVTPEGPVAQFVVRSKTPWPPGRYRFVVSQDGEEIKERAYTVEE